MLTIPDINPDEYLSVYIAVYFAREVLYIFEREMPDDMRPRRAIEVAEEYLRSRKVSADDAHAAYDASDSAINILGKQYISCVSNAASITANIANHASSARLGFTFPSVCIDWSRQVAILSASAALIIANDNTLSKEREYVHERLLKMLPCILQYKIDNQQSFGNPEKVLEYLNEEQQTVALFHLDSLV